MSATVATMPPCMAPIEFRDQSVTGSCTTPPGASSTSTASASSNDDFKRELSVAIVDGPESRTSLMSGLRSRRGSTEKLIVARPISCSPSTSATSMTTVVRPARSTVAHASTTEPGRACDTTCNVRSAVAIQFGCAAVAARPPPITSTSVASAPARAVPRSVQISGTIGSHARLVRPSVECSKVNRRSRSTCSSGGYMSVRGHSREVELDDVVALVDVQHRNGALRVDAAELIAFVRVAVAVEGPRVPCADQLVAGDVALAQVVVEVRASAWRRANPSVEASPHHELLTVDVHCNHASGRHCVALDAHSRLTDDVAYDARAVVQRCAARDRTTDHLAQEWRLRTPA